MRETKDILIAWKNTKALEKMDKGLSYSSHSTIASPTCSFDFRQYLSEREMKSVNSAMDYLKRDNIDGYTVLTNFYLSKISCSRQARVTGRRTDYITGILNEAENFIRGVVYEVFRYSE